MGDQGEVFWGGGLKSLEWCFLWVQVDGDQDVFVFSLYCALFFYSDCQKFAMN